MFGYLFIEKAFMTRNIQSINRALMRNVLLTQVGVHNHRKGWLDEWIDGQTYGELMGGCLGGRKDGIKELKSMDTWMNE